MKYPFIGLISLVIFFSCKKSTIADTPPDQKNDLVISFSEYVWGFPGQHTVVALSYDANRQLASIQVHKYDTSGGIPYVDSSLISFAITGQNTPPLAYDITWMIGTVSPHQISTEHHVLLYDDQQRITEDSMVSDTPTEPYVPYDPYNIKYSYSGGNVILELLVPYPASPDGYSHGRLDTFSIADGNLINRTSYSESSGSDGHGHLLVSQEFQESNTYLYSNDSNPLYQADISKSLGVLLRYNEIGDFISPSLARQRLTIAASGQSQPSISYVWSADASGRITDGLGTSQILGSTQNKDAFSFQYQH